MSERRQSIAGLAAATGEAADGWIKWAGGECPVDGATLVEVKLRDGTVYDDTGDELAWSHDRHRIGMDTDIVCYRVVAA